MASVLAAYQAYEPSFSRTLMWVAAGHAVVIFLFLLVFWWTPSRAEPVKFINMVPLGDLVQGTPDAPSAPAKPQAVAAVLAPPPTPTPAPPEPVQAQVEPAPPVAPAKPRPTKLVVKPTPALEPVAQVEPKPEPPAPKKKVEKPQPKVVAKTEPPKPKKKKKIKVSLKTVQRPETKTSQKSEPVKVALRTTPKPDEVMAKLDAVMKKAGSFNAPNLASRSGSQNGNDHDFSDYYRLIRDQMFGAWKHPRHLLGQGLSTIIQIELSPQGKVKDVQLVRSSGNDEHDATALAAVRSVSKIRRPVPEGMDPRVEINFRLQR